MEKLARVADVNGCLNFITSEYPKLDTSLFNVVDGLTDLVLQFIFDGGRTYKLKVDFKLLCNLINSCLLVYRSGCSGVFLLPGLVVIF